MKKILLITLLVACKPEPKANQAVEFVRLASPMASCPIHAKGKDAVSQDTAICDIPKGAVRMACRAGAGQPSHCEPIKEEKPAAPVATPTPVPADAAPQP